MKTALFEECQKFRRLSLLLPVIGMPAAVLILMGFVLYDDLGPGMDFWSIMALCASVSLVFMLPVLFFRLEVRVSDKGLETRFFPAERTFRLTKWADIEDCALTTIQPRRLGGVGLRRGRGRKAYIVSGNKGLEFRLKNGRVLFVGSRTPERFLAAVRLFVRG